MNRAAIAKCSIRGACCRFYEQLIDGGHDHQAVRIRTVSATGAGLVSEKSDRMLMLLQELAAMKESAKRTPADAAHGQRRKEITNEMKQLALQKKRADGS
jgi:hypothetical protein